MVLLRSVDDHINNIGNAPREQCADILQGNIQHQISGSGSTSGDFVSILGSNSNVEQEPSTDTRTVTTDLAGRTSIMSNINDPQSTALFGNMGFGVSHPDTLKNNNMGYAYNTNSIIGLSPGPNSVNPGTPIQTSGDPLVGLEMINGRLYAIQQSVSFAYPELTNPVNTLLYTSPF